MTWKRRTPAANRRRRRRVEQLERAKSSPRAPIPGFLLRQFERDFNGVLRTLAFSGAREAHATGASLLEMVAGLAHAWSTAK